MERSTNITNIRSQNSMLKKSLMIAGLGFMAVCVIGIIVHHLVLGTTNLESALEKMNQFDGRVFAGDEVYGITPEALHTMRVLNWASLILILVSGVLNMVWAFRVTRASKGFIYTAFTVFVLGQGIGFGVLFMMLKASTLIAIFGIAGGLMAIAGLVGFVLKDASPIRVVIMICTPIMLITAVIMLILGLTGIWSDTLYMIYIIFSMFMTLLWTTYTIWRVKRYSERYATEYMDDEMWFRFTMFFGFRLLSDFIALIWHVVNIYLRAKR